MPSIQDESLLPAHSASNGAEPDRSRPRTTEGDSTSPKTIKEPLPNSLASKKAGITFAAQDKLPKLPIPDLESSCKQYLEVLRPLQSDHEHEHTIGAVEEFLRSEGPVLQARLKKYSTGKSSYIEQFWYDSYLNFDNPVVLNLNPFFLLEDDPTPARNNQVTRAASLVVSALSFVRAIRKEELPPDTLRGQPLCMYQYSRIFGTARVPTENGCHIGQDPNAKHMVVLCRGQFYWFDVLDDNSDLIMTEKDLAINLEVIVEDAQHTPIQEAAKGAIGVLSTENRKIWASLRDVLTHDPDSNNADCLGIVDSALFILCLDYTSPTTGADLATNMLCGTSEVIKGVQVGTCTNRWYDKLQIIVCKNGSAGINFEHTGVDGHTVLRMASDVYTDTILRFARTINGQAPSLWASNSPDPSKRDPASFGDVTTIPHKLEWDMLPSLNTALRFAETRLADLIQQNEFQTLDFASYGKNFMTSMGFSPDAFVQMAFQAAYYGLYGRLECTYEPAMTKIYLHGRTEAIRSVSSEALDFVTTFWGDHPPAQKIDALRKACTKHTALTRASGKALGQDRHLYALYCVWQRGLDENGAEAAPDGSTSSGISSQDGDEGKPDTDATPIAESGLPELSPTTSNSAPQQIPAIFADAGWNKINTTILSTSNCGNPSLRHFGFGPTSADGFGIGYIIKDECVSICASSKHRQTKRFVEGIEGVFLEMRKLLKGVKKRGVSGGKASRAREVEERSERKVRGRVVQAQIAGDGKGKSTGGVQEEESDEDGLGGYGFFDAGMLKQALRSKAEQDKKKGEDAKEVENLRRNVGKKLRLMDY